MGAIDDIPDGIFLDFSPPRLRIHYFLQDVVTIAIDYAVNLVVGIRFFLFRLFFSVFYEGQQRVI